MVQPLSVNSPVVLNRISIKKSSVEIKDEAILILCDTVCLYHTSSNCCNKSNKLSTQNACFSKPPQFIPRITSVALPVQSIWMYTTHTYENPKNLPPHSIKSNFLNFNYFWNLWNVQCVFLYMWFVRVMVHFSGSDYRRYELLPLLPADQILH